MRALPVVVGLLLPGASHHELPVLMTWAQAVHPSTRPARQAQDERGFEARCFF
jgi:hypothetical protein